MKKYFLLLPLLVLVVALFGSSVQAAEITPDADSYSYGSTSEMSASATYDVEPDADEGSLADTGESTTYILIAATFLLVSGAFVSRRALKN